MVAKGLVLLWLYRFGPTWAPIIAGRMIQQYQISDCRVFQADRVLRGCVPFRETPYMGCAVWPDVNQRGMRPA